MNLNIINISRQNTLPGWCGHSDDRAVVVDLDVQNRHPLTGESQPSIVFSGTLGEAHAFVRNLDC